MTGLVRRLLARIRNRNFDSDLRLELDAHRAMVEDDLRAAGHSREDARYLAARRLGNAQVAREAAREVWVVRGLESVWQDARYAARSLWHSPGFTATALLTLTIGVGANTALFSLVSGLLLRPWPAPDAHQLVVVHHRWNGQLIGISAPELSFLREHATSADLAGLREVGGRLTVGAATQSASGRLVSGNYFNVLQVPMALGRGLQPEDDRIGTAQVIVIGHRLWTNVFAADSGVLGRTIRFEGKPVTVVGVAAAGVRESALSDVPQFWMPLSSMPVLFPNESFAQEFLTNAGHCCVELVGRLRPSFGVATAESELSALDRQFREKSPQDNLGMRVRGTDAWFDPQAAKVIPVFTLVLAGAGLIFLLTCANVGNLQLARAATRRREVSIRMSLGAARGRIVRQLLTEGLLLAATSTTLCLIVSATLARAVLTRMDPALAGVLDFRLDGPLLLLGAGLALVGCLVTSLAPALRGTRHLVTGRAAEGARVRLRSTFLAIQVAVSVVLLIAGALLSRGLAHAASQDVGFNLETLIALRIERESRSTDGDAAALGDALMALGTRRVATAAVTPLGDDSMITEVRRAGEPYEANRRIRFHPVSANFFDVAGIPLRSGRAFSDTATHEVVLNETLARMLWPDGNAIGGHLAGPGGSVGRQVVGIAADAHIDGLGVVGPMLFQPTTSLAYLLFNKGDVTVDELRAVVGAVDPTATTSVHAIADNVESSLETARFGAGVAGSLGLLALALAAVGIAGVFSFVVTERTREVGIRLALGASYQSVRGLLIRRTSGPVVAGSLVGVVLALLASQALRSYLHGLSPVDPIAYVAGIVSVALMAHMATVVPMRRALRVDPAVTLRHD